MGNNLKKLMVFKKFVLLVLFLTLANGELFSTKANEELSEEDVNESSIKTDYVGDRFKIYNKEVDSVTISTFITVTHIFSLDTTPELFESCISQICVESQAKHTKNNKVIVSSGNAIGITQIVPTTAHYYLKNVLSKSDIMLFKLLGATDLSFIKTTKQYRMTSYDRKLIITWLNNEKNNLILWGYIMNYNLHVRKYSLPKALIAYNQGRGFLHKYLKSGLNPNDYLYVKHVDKVINIFNKELINAPSS